MIATAEALRHFLERHNIPGRGRVRMVIVCEERRTVDAIISSMRQDFSPLDLDSYPAAPPPGCYAVIAGVAVAVATPKLAVEV